MLEYWKCGRKKCLNAFIPFFKITIPGLLNFIGVAEN